MLVGAGAEAGFSRSVIGGAGVSRWRLNSCSLRSRFLGLTALRRKSVAKPDFVEAGPTTAVHNGIDQNEAQEFAVRSRTMVEFATAEAQFWTPDHGRDPTPRSGHPSLSGVLLLALGECGTGSVHHDPAMTMT